MLYIPMKFYSCKELSAPTQGIDFGHPHPVINFNILISTMDKLEQLSPQPLFKYFGQICQVPRPSKKEEKIRKFLLDFADKHQLQAKTDNAGNVLITKPATPGKEKAPVVILQTHMDMVCEKNGDKVFNFDTDPIEPVVTDGWVKANGTTLGADCGIGIAAQLAVLTSSNIKHGPVECLITVDEETSLTGASELEEGFLTGSVMLNLDSEDEGELFIGCAGGIDTLATLTCNYTSLPEGSAAYRINVAGLLGGHSGDDIHKNRGNAIKIAVRFLNELNRAFSIKLSDIEGGNLRNAIPREASATVVIPREQKDNFIRHFEKFESVLSLEYELSEPNISITVYEVPLPDRVMDETTKNKLIAALHTCPHGVIEMSSRMEGMVETSTNLASVKPGQESQIIVTTSQRSEIESRKHYIAGVIRAVFETAGADVRHSEGYPGWTPNTESEILKTTVSSYKKLFSKEPVVRSIHAGLECGILLEKYPHLDMVSFGPTIKGAHSPDERLDIASTEKFWNHLVDVLESIS